MACSNPLRGIASLLAIAVLACGSTGATGQRPPALPGGYALYDGGQLGFRFGVAPGWRQAAAPAPDGVSFSDAANLATLLVHVGHARSADLTVATGAVVFDLTGGSGAAGGSESATTLAGRPARQVRGGFEAAGAMQAIQAVVAVEGGRAWTLALAGPPDRVSADGPDFDACAPRSSSWPGRRRCRRRRPLASGRPASPSWTGSRARWC